ncbi:winged helix-turn-helix domain-containing protein [Streptomyces albus]|uniref:winged helix-turn-helix domain-containing protein n=1 Tax=Streptomyces albus TaxID=1888 RepID=UPI0033CA82F2
MTNPTTALSTPSAPAGRKESEPDFDALLNVIRSATKTYYPNTPHTWERGADRLHAAADELLPHARAHAGNAAYRHLDHAIQALEATLRSRPRPAGIEHVMVLAGQLRTLIRLLRQDPGIDVAEAISRTIATGKKGYGPGDFVTKGQLCKDFSAPHPLIDRAVRLLVDQGVLEVAGKRQLRVPVPGEPYRRLPEHVAHHLRERIVSGIYRDGQTLPSHRSLATRFGCSPTVVSQALACLRAEGLVAWARGRPATVIRPRRPLPAAHERPFPAAS